MTPEQRVLLAGIGGWPLTWVLADPDQGILYWKGTQAGGTWVYGTPWGWGRTWYQVGAKRITLGRFVHDAEPLAAVTWTEVRRFAVGLPEDMRTALQLVRDDGQRLAQEDHDDPSPYRDGPEAMAEHQVRWDQRLVRHRRHDEEQRWLLDHLLDVTRGPGTGDHVLLAPTELHAPEPAPAAELTLFDLTGADA